MTAALARHDYATRDDLASALASGVAAVLAGGIATSGRALLAVSGGSTPALFFEHLAREPIDWAKVVVLPVDDRLVHPAHERSNAKLIREHLLVDAAAAARFAPMGERDGRMALADDEATLAIGGEPVDALVLGMGGDGHTASFFADGDSYDEATDPTCPVAVLPLRTPSQPEGRITLTMPVILGARFLALHIEGDEKRDVLARAVSEAQGGARGKARGEVRGEAGDAPGAAGLPIARVLRHAPSIEVFWTA